MIRNFRVLIQRLSFDPLSSISDLNMQRYVVIIDALDEWSEAVKDIYTFFERTIV